MMSHLNSMSSALPQNFSSIVHLARAENLRQAVEMVHQPFLTPRSALRGQAYVTDSIAIRAVVADGVPGDPENQSGTQVILDAQDGIFGNGEICVLY